LTGTQRNQGLGTAPLFWLLIKKDGQHATKIDKDSDENQSI
jgi:hypothetical protein